MSAIRLLTLVILNSVLSDAELKLSDEDLRKIQVTGSADATENSTFTVPCDINNEEKDKLLGVQWYKDTQLLLYSGKGWSEDGRFRLDGDNNLLIWRLMEKDEGNYYCAVERKQPWSPIFRGYYLGILTPPKIKTFPEDGYVETSVGQFVHIGCDVSGNPHPDLEWHQTLLFKHPIGRGSVERLKFKVQNRRMAGTFVCTATNRLGKAQAMIQVVVHAAPEVQVNQSFVHTAVGLRATLIAEVPFASPPARTAWYRHGQKVKTGERIVTMVREDQHWLIFREVRASDFGNYTFRAENSLGMADASFKLTGVPHNPTIKNHHNSVANGTSFTVVWEVDSYSTIIEYNLWIRPSYHLNPETNEFYSIVDDKDSKWRRIVVPGENILGPIHSASYTLRGLTPSMAYAVQVSARNRYGWSSPSSDIQFRVYALPGWFKPRDYESEITPMVDEDTDYEEPHNITHAQMFDVPSSGERETVSYLAAILIFARALF